MRLFVATLAIFLLNSCGHPDGNPGLEQIENADSVKIDSSKIKVDFDKVNGKGILIGENIKLLDQNFQEIKDITYLNGQIVEFTEVSRNFHKISPGDDYCHEFKYVRIKTKDLNGYVDGLKLYEPVKNANNKVLKFNNLEVSFIGTRNFGIGVSDADGLTFCSIKTPVLFYDQSNNYEGLVKMVKNKNYKDDYPYFELKDDDMAGDEILNVEKQDGKYILSILRIYQEGGAKLKVVISMDKNRKFVAEIIEDLGIDEEELQEILKN